MKNNKSSYHGTKYKCQVTFFPYQHSFPFSLQIKSVKYNNGQSTLYFLPGKKTANFSLISSTPLRYIPTLILAQLSVEFHLFLCYNLMV